MNVLVVGAGMYVAGRGTRGLGTILPALAQASRAGEVRAVTVVATQPDNGPLIEQAASRVNALLGTSLEVSYLSLRETLAATLAGLHFDCAIVCVPDHLHFEVAQQLMGLGIHCLIVKPLTPTLLEARRLVGLQEARGLHCAVEFHKRFDEQNLLVRKAIREGRLGRLLYLVVAYSQRIDLPLQTFRAWADRTNIFQYLGVHYVDLIYFLTGFRPARAMAVGTRGVLDGRGVKTFDSVHATVVWQGAKPGEEMITQFAVGWVDPASTSALSDQRFVLVGSEGRMELDQKDRGVTLVTQAEGIESLNPYFSMILEDAGGAPAFQGYGYRSIERFLLDVGDVIAGRVDAKALEASRPTLRQSLVSTAVVEAVNQSLRAGGEWRPVDDPA